MTRPRSDSASCGWRTAAAAGSARPACARLVAVSSSASRMASSRRDRTRPPRSARCGRDPHAGCEMYFSGRDQVARSPDSTGPETVGFCSRRSARANRPTWTPSGRGDTSDTPRSRSRRARPGGVSDRERHCRTAAAPPRRRSTARCAASEVMPSSRRSRHPSVAKPRTARSSAAPARQQSTRTGAQGRPSGTAIHVDGRHAQADHRRDEVAQVDGDDVTGTAVSAAAATTGRARCRARSPQRVARDSRRTRRGSSGARSRARAGCRLRGAVAHRREHGFIAPKNRPTPMITARPTVNPKRKSGGLGIGRGSSRSPAWSSSDKRPSLSTRARNPTRR